jgi:glyoxylase-like metal-dependent hydrolase (beta-lactamase superfamily II)
MHELLPGILYWGVLSEPHGYDFNGTLVRHPEGNLCIDPVEAGDAVLDRLAEEGVARILITNRNHTRGALRVRERTGAPIAIHPADSAHAREEGVRADQDLSIGEEIGPFEVRGAAGKSPGEIVLYDAARRLLVVGDVLIGNPPGELSVLPERVMDDPAGLRDSVRGLLALDLETVVVGDGVSVTSNAKKELEKLVAKLPE